MRARRSMVAMVVAGGLMLVSAGCSGGDDPEVTGGTTPVASTTTTSVPDTATIAPSTSASTEVTPTASTLAPTQAPDGTVLSGSEVKLKSKDGTATLVVHSARWSSSVNGMFAQAPKNDNYLILDYSVRLDEGTFMVSDFYVSAKPKNPKGGKNAQSTPAAMMAVEPALPTIRLTRPGSFVRGLVAFDVPTKVTSVQVKGLTGVEGKFLVSDKDVLDTSAELQQPVDTPLAVGDTASITAKNGATAELTVDSLKISSLPGKGSSLPPRSGSYVLLGVTIRGTKGSFPHSYRDYVVVTSQGHGVNPGSAVTTDALESATLTKGKKIKGTLGFDINPGSGPIQVVVQNKQFPMASFFVE